MQIYKVEGFLKALNEDSNTLRTVNALSCMPLFCSYLFHSHDVVLNHADPQDGKSAKCLVKTD